MSGANFTKGPWILGNENNACAEVCIGDTTCSLSRQDNMSGRDVISRQEMLANAHLIMAAPDMYDALISIEEYWNRDQNEKAMADALHYIIETAQAAIAKANT